MQIRAPQFLVTAALGVLLLITTVIPSGAIGSGFYDTFPTGETRWAEPDLTG